MISDLSSDADTTPNDSQRSSSTRRRIIRGSCLFTAIVIVVLLGFGIREARRAAKHVGSKSPFGGILLAFHNYHHEHGHLPPAYIADENGKPMHSWRVLILPFIEENKLYKAYDFDEPWDGPNNSKLAEQMPDFFHIPTEKESTKFTNFVLITGQGTAFPGSETTKFQDFTEELRDTILLTEITNSKIPWLQPRDINIDDQELRVNDLNSLSISAVYWRAPFVGFADGSNLRNSRRHSARDTQGAHYNRRWRASHQERIDSPRISGQVHTKKINL